MPLQRTVSLAPLVRAAQQAGLPFESSPTGRWIRLAGQQGVAYVVQDAWGEGCLLMDVDRHDGSRTEHFLKVEPAVQAAARRAGLLPAVSFAEAG